MTIRRDNDEERMARIEHILARLADGRINSEILQQQARRVLADLHDSKERRRQLVESMQSRLDDKASTVKRRTPKRSRP
jgi:hypothetical protein